jgi:HAD superfamily hydrolase (TIGR01458 family)
VQTGSDTKPAVRGLLVDLDGTLVERGQLVAGAVEALERRERRGVSHRFVTNTTSRPRAELVAELAAMGHRVDPESIFTAPLAARDYLVSRRLTRAMMLVQPALLEDFEGVELVADRPDAVVVGDLGEALTFAALDDAFRALVDGAELVALARNRYFMGRDGRLTLDVGPFVVALEYASGRAATLVGKPSAEFFRLALSALGVAAGEAAVVGDDLEGDVGGAQSAGMRGVLVRTGKFREDALAASPIRPDAVIASLAQIEEAI